MNDLLILNGFIFALSLLSSYGYLELKQEVKRLKRANESLNDSMIDADQERFEQGEQINKLTKKIIALTPKKTKQ